MKIFSTKTKFSYQKKKKKEIKQKIFMKVKI